MANMTTGKKTWFGLLVTFIPSLIGDVVTVLQTPGDDAVQKIVAIAGKILIVVGAAHKIQRGE